MDENVNKETEREADRKTERKAEGKFDGTMNRGLRIALYMRLSIKEKEEEGESGSIQNQRILLLDFIKKHFQEYSLYEFLDDGFSGKNMNRPGVIKMLDMVKEAALDCIMVKDFSRFSRDYIELGSYMEQIFPFMRVRFISINDHYDSAEWEGQAGELDVCFRNLMYDLYSKDLSVKVKSSLEIKKARGQYISASCPFGYVKAPEDKHKLLIQEKEAQVVRRIFALTLEGMSSTEIARIFNKEGVRTPGKFRSGAEPGRAAEGGTESLWGSSTVCAILRNEVYMGDMVYGKTSREGPGGRSRMRPRGEWKVFRNHHAPIVSREVFQEIQKRRGGKCTFDRGKRNPLRGRLVCACCGRNLYLRRGEHPYFCCPGLYTNFLERCVRKADAGFLEQRILSEIQRREAGRWNFQELWQHREEELAQRRKALRAERRRLHSKKTALERERAEAYMRYTEVETAGDYKACRRFLQETERREKELETLLWEREKNQEYVEKQLTKKLDRAELMAYYGLDRLTEDLAERFLEKIVVSGEETLEIYWKET